MSNFKIEPTPMDKDKMMELIGKLLWGKNGKSFSLIRLIIALKKKEKELKGEAKSEQS